MILKTLPAPYPPLVDGGAGLEAYPGSPDSLAARMAALYEQPIERILPTRGVTHGLELVFRLAAREGGRVEAPDAEPYRTLASLYPPAQASKPLSAMIVRDDADRLDPAALAAQISPALLVVDEGAIEFSGSASALRFIDACPNLIVLRSLSLAYGLAGVRIGAAIGRSEALDRLRAVLEPYALAESSVRLALTALHPSRVMETAARVSAVLAERDRLVAALAGAVRSCTASGPTLRLEVDDPHRLALALRRLETSYLIAGHEIRLTVASDPRVNDRLLSALGLGGGLAQRRSGQITRDTNETRIVCAVDLDVPAPVSVETGIAFFDHMLEQVATHGGFSLRLACEGDLQVDPHHTVEDCAIALGQCLKQALGARRGIGRYGFVLPMDEAEASVSIDLSGRPHAVFNGVFFTPMLGAYRTDLTRHVVKSLADALGASIHVTVVGEDDHHKTEAVFKVLGRALRQAIRLEGDAVPSTKGVL